MALLADAIKAYGGNDGEVDKPVLDKTGLSGRFDFTIEYAPGPNDSIRRVNDLLRSRAANADSPQNSADSPPNPEGAPLLNAVRDQLGLKLAPSKGTTKTLVIDHVEKPSEN
jgi:bla regulator protein blaR1